MENSNGILNLDVVHLEVELCLLINDDSIFKPDDVKKEVVESYMQSGFGFLENNIACLNPGN